MFDIARPFTGLLALLIPLATSVEAQEQGPTLSVEQRWSKGGVNPSPEGVWKRIVDVTVIDGKVIVVDAALAEVRAFGVEGGFIGNIGGQGAGPGEFVRPYSVTSLRNGFAVYDLALSRAVFFDESLEHVGTFGLAPPGIMHLQKVWQGRGNYWLAETPLVSRRDSASSRTDHTILMWQASAAPDTLASIAGNPFWIYPKFRTAPIMHTVETSGPSGGATVLGDSILVIVDGIASVARVSELSPSGLDETWTVRLPGSARRVTPEDRELARDAYFRKYSVDPDDTTIEEIRIADYLPAWTRVISDDKGGVWLRRGETASFHPASGERWLRWDLSTGRYAELALPVGVRALCFREGLVVGVEMDALGVESLVVFAIRSADAPGSSEAR